MKSFCRESRELPAEPEDEHGHDADVSARLEETICKRGALELFDSGLLETLGTGDFESLSKIHRALFAETDDSAGKLRTVNIAKGSFRFAAARYLGSTVEHVGKMPQSTFDEIVEKYVEMNAAHPFRDGNGRSARIWFDAILRNEIGVVVDWSMLGTEEYLSSMEESPVDDAEIKRLLRGALTEKIDDRGVFAKGIDASCRFEGLEAFLAEEL